MAPAPRPPAPSPPPPCPRFLAHSLALSLAILPNLQTPAAPAPSLSPAQPRSALAPRLEFTAVPAVGATDPLRGQAHNVNPSQHRVAVYIYVFGWWTKPSWTSPLTSIQNDGSWACNITTGSNDPCATSIAAFLIPASYSPPLLAGQPELPAELDQNALHKILRVRAPAARTLSFSGYEWAVKATAQCQWGPGPNYYSDSTGNVWTDSSGRLHLRLTHRQNRWECAEVALTRSLGYGTYRFELESPVDQLDPHVVLGLFTWSDDPAYAHREIDIEFSRWSDPSNPNNAQFVVQPFNRPQHLLGFRHPSGVASSVHSFLWEPHQVAFQSRRGSSSPGSGSVIQEWTFTRTALIPPPGDETARVNLWLFNGVPPANGQEVEVVIARFEFTPAAPSLRIARSGSSAVISWLAGYRGFKPETAASAQGPWAPLESSPQMADRQLELTRSLTEPAGLFRLKRWE